MDDFAALGRLVGALRPWLEHLVLVGGWAHRLHRLHPRADPPAYLPIKTRDADVAFSPRAPLPGDIGAALRAAGFEEELSGDHVPPVSEYRLGGDDQGFYAEFLVPLQGSGRKRDGTPDATMARAGVTAQKLRHLDLLLVEPWEVGLSAAVGVPMETRADVRIANPVSFIAQKLLIHAERPPAKQAQDVLYIHDTVELFGRELETLGAVWRDEVRPSLAAKTARQVEALSRERFAVVTDVLRNAARIPQDRRLEPERARRVCEAGLAVIFGSA